MLLDRAASVVAKIGEYQKLKNSGNQAEHFQTRASQFGSLSEKLARAAAGLQTFANAGVPVGFTPSDSRGYAAKAKALRAAVKENPAAINDPPFDLKHDFMDRVSAISTAAEKSIAESWKGYVAKRANFGSYDVLSALSEIPQFRQTVTKISQRRAEVASLGNIVPSDPRGAVARLDELISEHDASWSELSATDIPKGVIAFIHAAAREGAALTAYTDEVRGWLASHNLFTGFRIRLR